MASTALVRVRGELAAKTALYRKSLAAARSKVAALHEGMEPKKVVVYFLIGLLVGTIVPRLLGRTAAGKERLDRKGRRWARIAVGLLVTFIGYKRRAAWMYLGVGILGSEVLLSGGNWLAPKLGLENLPEIGALDAEIGAGRSDRFLSAARREVFGDASPATVLAGYPDAPGPNAAP